MSERQRELIHDLRIELEETKAKLAASQGREAAMRAALERLIERWDANEIGQVDGEFIDDARAALATDGSGWVSPEAVSGLVEALTRAMPTLWDEVERTWESVEDWPEAVDGPPTLAHDIETLRLALAALAAFENSKRGGK